MMQRKSRQEDIYVQFHKERADARWHTLRTSRNMYTRDDLVMYGNSHVKWVVQEEIKVHNKKEE